LVTDIGTSDGADYRVPRDSWCPGAVEHPAPMIHTQQIGNLISVTNNEQQR
jgi:hypothetical protein